MFIRLLCRKMGKKETPKSPKIGGQGVEVSKTLFYFIGNSDVGEHKKKHMFIEHMLDKRVFGHGDRTKKMLEDIKSFDTRFVSK